MNFSTRPAVSTNRWVRVKNGWHFEQTSTRISGFTDRVFTVSPHAQMTVHSTYWGWIPFFMA